MFWRASPWVLIWEIGGGKRSAVDFSASPAGVEGNGESYFTEQDFSDGIVPLGRFLKLGLHVEV